jgi:hypothetical protein
MSVPLPAPARYIPYGDVGDQPHIIVDGAPLDSTILTLSHWPNNHTHDAVRRDTSTATVFAYLDSPELHRDVALVSNHHFDEDGLFSMFGIVDPAAALAHRELLIDASFAGDFGVFENPDAGRLCFVIESFCDPATSPLPAATFEGCERRRVAALYNAMLERVPELAADVGAWEALWYQQFAHLEASRELLERGVVTIEEYADLDLAVVNIPDNVPERTVRRYLESEQAAVHPFAIHQQTGCNRLLRITGQRYELQYRYESWVQLASRRPLLRAALDDLAAELNTCEQAAGEWRCEAVGEVVPRLWLDGVRSSSLEPGQFIDTVRDYLATAPVAWNPYDWDGK